MDETVDNNSNKLRLKEVKIIEYICDKCHAGKMKPTNIMLTSTPPKYEHVCPYCNSKAILDHTYPRTVIILE